MKKIIKPSQSTTWMEINLTRLEQNYLSIAKHVGNDVGIISVLKSNAYGHGLNAVAQCLSNLGTEKIGLASTKEVSELRHLGIQTPLLLLYPAPQSDLIELIKNNTEITVDNLDDVLCINLLAVKLKKVVKIHIYINTGLNRYGIHPTKATEFIEKVSRLKNVFIEGLWTHYINSESNIQLSKQQFSVFLKIIKSVSEIGIKIPFIHIANSGAICNLPNSFSKEILTKHMPTAKILVRPGCLLYGTYSKIKNRNKINIKPILDSLQTRVVNISSIKKGDSIGYFQKFTASKKMTVATLPVGWGNTGYNPSFILTSLNNTYSKGVGLISSNNMAIDITKVRNVKINSNVFLLKKDDKKINTDKVAKQHGMFVNQFISMIGSKVEYVYFEDKNKQS